MFLFDRDDRPDAQAMRKVIASEPRAAISAEMQNGEATTQGGLATAFELLWGGLTFDLTGMHPAQSVPIPDIRSWLAMPSADRAGLMGCLGMALGPHIRAGQADVTILRGLLELANGMLAGLPQCRGICWSASGTIVAPDAFAELVKGWRSRGTMPAQMIVSVKQALGGGIETKGLAHFTGQELRLEPAVATDEGQATLLALRLSAQLIHRGRMDAAEDFAGPDGRLLRLEPSPNGRFIRVWPG